MKFLAEYQQSIHELLGKEEEDKYFLSIQKESPVSVRLNPFKWNLVLPSRPVPWTDHAYYLDKRPIYTLDPLFHAGFYYVQEPSSMLIDWVFNQLELPDKELRVLDLCAAPGGKSTLMRSIISDDSLLVSNETVPSRAKILADNLIRWGHPGVIVTRNDPSAFAKLPSCFDVMLVDAPCSGEGLFRKSPDAKNEWSPENVRLCAARQKRILFDSWQTVKSGGYILYSTCTHNRHENEEVVSDFCSKSGSESIRLAIPDSFGVVESSQNGVFVYRCWPHKVNGEGFTFSLIRINRQDEFFRNNNKRGSLIRIKNKQFQVIQSVLPSINDVFEGNNDLLYYYPQSVRNFLLEMGNLLTIIKAGTLLGQIIRDTFIPSIDIFLSAEIKISYPVYPLNMQDALKYMKKELNQLTSDEQSYITLLFEDKQIGFGKNIKTRFNSGWPSEWKILMKIPDQPDSPFWM